MKAPFRLAVLNAGGRDPEQDFPDGSGDPARGGHPPVNFHAYAACTGGSFHASAETALRTERPVLLLLRRDLRGGWKALQRLKAAGRTVIITFKEAGAMQLAERLCRPAHLTTLAEIVALADGCLAPTPWLAAFLRGFGKETAFIPTPYPVSDPRWNFEAPERRGIFIGTREFGTPSRQHLAALVAARELHGRTGEPITVFNLDGRRGAKMLGALGLGSASLRVLDTRLPYPAYLREMAGHKLVFQLDRSGVPGQVAGDALLCRIPCVGGDGAVEQLAFPHWAGKNAAELIEIAANLLTDANASAQARADAHDRASATVSYEAVAARLAACYHRA